MPNLISLFVVIAISALIGILFHFLYKRRIFGGIYLAIIVSVVGGILGFYYFGTIINWLVINQFNINFISVIIGSILLLWVAAKVTPQ